MNYYPFGMQQTGTACSYDLSSDYRYGYNGKEKDDEIKGEANSLDYGFRIYDPRVGKFLSTDPLQLQFPFMSPFIYAADDPISMIDEDGKGPKPSTGATFRTGIFFISYFPISSLIGKYEKGSENISTNAVRFSTRGEVLYGSRKDQIDEGSENGAFRHTLWQATITSYFGSDIAKEAGDAHEDNPNSNLVLRKFNKTTSIIDLDQKVDLLNNIIGRRIGESNKGATMNDLANLVLDEFKNNGLYTTSKDKDGNWIISRTKLSSEKYDQLKNIFKGLNENGRTVSEQRDADQQKIDELGKAIREHK